MDKHNNLKKAYVQKLIFYVSIIVLPLLQFFIFYLCVNFNSLMLSFNNYTIVDGVLTQSFVGLTNVGNAFKQVFSDPIFAYAWKNSIIFYFKIFISVYFDFAAVWYVFGNISYFFKRNP